MLRHREERFVNRKAELALLDEHARAGGLLVLFGRRRVGKTRLLTQWLGARHGLYSQAIEASKDQQLEQLVADFATGLSASVRPRTFAELLELLDLNPKLGVVCIDEFPYLVATDPSVPSVLQRWLDHRRHERGSLVLAGSSTRMMNDLFLNRGAPLFGRARRVVDVGPMSYGAFCQYRSVAPTAPASFALYSLVGGVPAYWALVERGAPEQVADALFFAGSPFLEFEPARLLRDEGVGGLTALSVLEAVGRGAEKPSEIAARLGVPQTALSRALQTLVDARLLQRQLPFGESSRTTKRSLYRIADPTLRFWFRVYSPHRSRWATYTAAERRKLVEDHASTVFEDELRRLFSGAERYWEAGTELDIIQDGPAARLVAEVKWARLSKSERRGRVEALQRVYGRCGVVSSKKPVRFEVFDQSMLASLARAV